MGGLLLQLIETLIGGSDLSEGAAEASLDLLLREGNEALISAFLVLLRAKGETYEEVSALSLSLALALALSLALYNA